MCDAQLQGVAAQLSEYIDGSDAIAASVFDMLDTEHAGYITKAQFKDKFFDYLSLKVREDAGWRDCCKASAVVIPTPPWIFFILFEMYMHGTKSQTGKPLY